MQRKPMSATSVLVLLCLALAFCLSAEAATVVKRTSAKHRSSHAKALKAKDDGDDDQYSDETEDGDNEEDEVDEEDPLAKGVEEAKAALDENVEEQKQLQASIDHLKDTKSSDMEIDANVKLVKEETESDNLANMLGSMWKEMRMFEVPSYEKYVAADIANMKKTEGDLKANLQKAEHELVAAKKQSGAQDQEEPEKEDEEEGEPKIAAELAGPEMEMKTPEIFPVPTTSRCIVIMVCQYMIVYTALAICRVWHELRGTPKGKLEGALRAAAQTLTYGPMLCVLFIACRMRVEFLSDGKGQPQMWVQQCMYALTFAVMASTLLVLSMPFITGRPAVIKEGTCDVETPSHVQESGSKAAWYVLTTVRYLILLGLYGGLVGVMVGICTYTPPGVSDASKLPAPAPAVLCTMILAVLFFATQLVLAICRSVTEFRGIELLKIQNMMNNAASAVEFAPQLAILFLAARMRALQHDGQPQKWAQTCMYSATAALCINALLACVVPLVMGGTMKTNPVTKEKTFEVPNPVTGIALVVLRFLCMAYFYGGAVGVAYSIFVFESPEGPEHTLPVSPTVRCVVNLTCQFFFVYLLQTIMLTVSEVSSGAVPLEKNRMFAALEAAKATLAFAPMLSILFVTTRMYALLITDKKGAPQAWVQDGMFMATWALFISFVSCLATGLVVDKVETDEDGNVINKFSNRAVAIAMLVVRYSAMLLLYGGIVTVVVGLFVMTPETANGRGSVPIVTDVISKTPMGNPPPNAEDIPDVGE